MPSDRHEPPAGVPLAVHVDTDECVSSGRCVASAPGFFVFDDDELAQVDASGERPTDETLVRIARQCPSGAISLTRGGEPIDL